MRQPCGLDPTQSFMHHNKYEICMYPFMIPRCDSAQRPRCLYLFIYIGQPNAKGKMVKVESRTKGIQHREKFYKIKGIEWEKSCHSQLGHPFPDYTLKEFDKKSKTFKETSKNSNKDLTSSKSVHRTIIGYIHLFIL